VEIKRIRVVKPFRFALRVFERGEIGEVVEVEVPLVVCGKSIYDCYAQFPEMLHPVGVRKDEYEVVEDGI